MTSVTVTGSLDTVLQAVADYLSLDYTRLALHAANDPHTGWDYGKGDWPCGSLHRTEGQILYALVRALGAAPVEIGSFCGCSATHMAQALRDTQAAAVVQAVDIVGLRRDYIPTGLLPLICEQRMDGAAYLRSLSDGSLDMIYEDGSHFTQDVCEVWAVGQTKLKPGGVLLSHDADHPAVGHEVCAGIEAAGVTDYLIVRAEPSDCGLALWRKGD